MGALIRSRRDWEGLGAPEAWPPSLRTVLRLMLASRYAMWLGWGPELRFFYNDAYREQTLGTKHPWALGRRSSEVWSEIWGTIGPRIDHVLATGEATWDEGLLLFLERNGYAEETYHTFSYSPAPNDDGSIGGLFCVVIEETERVIGERRLELLQDLASLLVEAKSSADVLAALEACLASDAREFAFSLTYLFDGGAPRARRAARTAIDEAHPAAPLLVDAADPSAPWRMGERLAGAQVLPLDPEGSWPKTAWGKCPTHAIAIPIVHQGEERPAGVFIAGLNPYRPVDEGAKSFARLFVGQLAAALSNARGYEEQKQRAEALAEIDRAKTTFFSNVSHEFRTPLTLMLAPIDDLRSSPGRDPEERAQIELLHRNARRLLKLVNTLLEFSRIEAGRVEAAYEPTDLAALTRDLASGFRAAVERAGVALVVDCAPLAEPIHVDRTMWEKIVLNLLSNAFKFTFEGSITVRLRPDGRSGARLEIADTGSGIAPEELPRLFERFHRIEGARSRSHEGSGIGLALVHELVRMHGGEVRVESSLGKGTTFAIAIPSGTAHLPPGRIRESRPLPTGTEGYVEEALGWEGTGPVAAGGETERAGPLAGPRERIVFADDNADMRAYVARLLGERWAVESVSDGEGALDACRHDPPDLVLSDVMMPGLDGFGLLRALRSDATLRAIPVLLLSARAGEEAAAEGLNLGADDYLVKPFTARELVIRVAARLAAVRAARQANAQREELAAELRVTAQRLEAAQRVAGIGIFDWEVGRGDVYVSAELNALRGNDPLASPATPEALADSVLAEDRARACARFQGAIDARQDAIEVEVRLRRPDDTTRWVRVSAQILYDDDAHAHAGATPKRVVGAVVDVQVLKEAAAARAAALEDAERTSRAKDEFLATMSHELRTPLNAMLGWARMLQSDHRDQAKLDKGLAVIERNAVTQARLVSDLLDVSRIITGKLRLTLQRVDLASVIQAAIEVVRPAADARRVALVTTIDDSVGTVTADPDRVQQIVWNLLANAVRFTPAYGAVTVSAWRREGAVRIVVDDTGAGIASEHLPYIFERFRQVDASTTRAHGGLGLGLAIVRYLVEAHGGLVDAQSPGLGNGATFSVTLPVRAVVAPDAGTGAVASPGSNGSSSHSTTVLENVRALVVDDDQDSLELLRVVLEGAGATIVTATGASEALEARGPYDIIISDIGMPQIDGYAFMRRFRGRESGGGVPALALTAYARAEDAALALQAGFNEHLSKPVDVAKLIDVVRRWTRPGAT